MSEHKFNILNLVAADAFFRVQEAKDAERASFAQFARAMDRAYNPPPPTFSHPAEKPTSTAAPGYIPLDALRKTKPAKIGSFTEAMSGSRVPPLTKISNPTFGGGTFEQTAKERAQERLREEKEKLDYIEKQVLESWAFARSQEERELELAHQDVNRLKAKIEKGDQSSETRKEFEEAYHTVGKLSQQTYSKQDRPATKIEGVACADQCMDDLAQHTQSQIEKTREKLRRPAIAEGRLA